MTDNTGPTLPATAADVSLQGNTWSNINNIKTTGSSYATCTPIPGGAPLTDYIAATNFGFSIPTNATIVGYQLTVKGFWSGSAGSGGSIQDSAIQLTTNGSAPVGNNKSNFASIGTVSNTLTYGGSADTWGNSLTVSQVNSSTFGAMLSYSNTDSNSWSNSRSTHCNTNPNRGKQQWNDSNCLEYWHMLHCTSFSTIPRKY